MYDMMKKQNFGVEIELTGITREQAANVIATYFGTQTRYLGTYYDTYGAPTGRAAPGKPCLMAASTPSARPAGARSPLAVSIPARS